MRSVAGALLVALAATTPAVAAADPSPDVPPSAIERLMFTQREAERVMGVGLPNVQRQSATFALDTDRPDCGSVVLASVSSYDRAPYTAAHSQALWDHPGWFTLVDQSVAVFSTAEEARDFARGEADRWRKCEHQSINVSELAMDGTTLEATVDIREITQADNVLAVSYGRNDSAYASCQHVLLGERNVAIDIRTCSTVSKNNGERAFELMKIVGPRVWEA
ncbi:sensor domain-containing protein [Mycobacteroides saopaulense]|uniref:Sensor domain-containing protein n=1 Tax=Mycobacteroides saopaulense TaxID=1578165 RepID=A0ABX3C0G2_9MYCO|nr:sensor domain-containing protein [Mycobacteroides saopaulense]OHT83199.1 sensor domain-containing protein [Mycobacteroides saopaulense]OHU09901.1 sensor domain-containing protein [Mycobacteroides saopaulense]